MSTQRRKLSRSLWLSSYVANRGLERHLACLPSTEKNCPKTPGGFVHHTGVRNEAPC